METASPSLLFEDDNLVAVHKPSNLLTHRTPMNKGEKDSMLNRLEDSFGHKFFTIHRLDKATSGVMLFGKNADAARFLSNALMNGEFQKHYIALVRGYAPEAGTQDRALQKDPDSPWQEALTHYSKLEESELNHAVSRYATSRYSLMLLEPRTGRYHQLRKHMGQLRHYIIGDKAHGDVKHNKAFAHDHGLPGLFLHALSLRFPLPNGDVKHVMAAPPSKWAGANKLLQWEQKAWMDKATARIGK